MYNYYKTAITIKSFNVDLIIYYALSYIGTPARLFGNDRDANVWSLLLLVVLTSFYNFKKLQTIFKFLT